MAAGCRYWERGLGVGWRCDYAFTLCGHVAGHGLCGYEVLADPVFAHSTFAHTFPVWTNSSAAYLTSSLPAPVSLLARLPADCLLRYLPAGPPAADAAAAAGGGTLRLAVTLLYGLRLQPAGSGALSVPQHVPHARAGKGTRHICHCSVGGSLLGYLTRDAYILHHQGGVVRMSM